jgi:hypothetical protein
MNVQREQSRMWVKWFPWKFIIRRLARSHGFIDPVAVLSHIERFAQPSEVTVPVEMLRAGMVFHARGLINSRVIQQNLDWVWPYWVHQQFNPLSNAFIPRAFSLTHINLTCRNWTAVGVPDWDLLPIVDPRGLATPLLDGWSLDAWILAEDGRLLAPSRLAQAEQHLDLNEGLAVVTVSQESGLQLDSRAEVTEEPRPDAVGRRLPRDPLSGRGRSPGFQWTLRARADARAWLVVSVRPYNPEGISFIHRIDSATDNPGWVIDNKTHVHFSEPPRKYAFSNYYRGDVLHSLPEPRSEKSIVCSVGMATAAALFGLDAGQPEQIIVRVPLRRHEPESGAGGHFTATVTWEKALSGACHIDVPDMHFCALYEAALRTVALHSPGEVYPGPYTYKRFWFRDAVFILHALLCAGLSRRARRAIDQFFHRQSAAGYFCSQEGEWDSNGQVLWLLHRFCELTGVAPDPAWLRPIRKAAHWITAKRQSSPKDPCSDGLLPAGFSAEHLGPNDNYYWDDFWSVAGLQAAGAMFRTTGRGEDADWCERTAASLTQAIDRSLELGPSRSAEGGGSLAMPASCHRRLDSGAIGSIVAGYPLQVMAGDDKRLVETAGFLMEHCLVGGGFFQDMIHSGINAYLTLHLAQVLLAARDARFQNLIEAVARLASPTGQWPEAIHPQTRGGCMGDGQHVWAAAEWIMMLRNCLLYEQVRPDRLVIGAGVFPRWLHQQRRITIGPAPTRWGPVRLFLDPAADSVDVHWQADWFGPAPEIEVRLPACRPVLVSDGKGSVHVPLDSPRPA